MILFLYWWSIVGVEFLRQLNFERIITSRLNPLKVRTPLIQGLKKNSSKFVIFLLFPSKICLSSIVEMFASLANHHEIAFCYTILEQNKRLVLSSVGNSTPHAPGLQINSTPSQNNYLDCFFPFDPYQLKRYSGAFNGGIGSTVFKTSLLFCVDQESSYIPCIKNGKK